MNATFFRNLRIGLALGLIGLQAVIVMTGLFWPDTSPAYRATYITHARDCWLPPAAPAFLPAGDVIVPLALSPYQACQLLPKGWNAADASYVWSSGRIARIDIPLRPRDAKVTIRLIGYSPFAPQSVEIIQPNGPSLKLVIPPGAIGKAVFPAATGESSLPIEIIIEHVHHPLERDVSDWRAIGVALLDVTRAS